jgi:hypothetical protein
LTTSANSSVELRSKAIYVLSGLLKHNAPAVEALGKSGPNGWETLVESLQDPSISVRRKAIFLLSTLLIPSITVRARAPRAAPLLIGDSNAATSAVGTPSTQGPVVASGLSGPAGPALHTPDEPTPEPIHDNSHVAHLKDPSRTDTSPLTLKAFNEHGILDTIISAVTSPLPYGADGENTETDVDFEEKAVRLLHTYVVTCKGTLSTGQKHTLRTWLKEQKGSESLEKLSERWSLADDEVKALFAAVA